LPPTLAKSQNNMLNKTQNIFNSFSCKNETVLFCIASATTNIKSRTTTLFGFFIFIMFSQTKLLAMTNNQFQLDGLTASETKNLFIDAALFFLISGAIFSAWFYFSNF